MSEFSCRPHLIGATKQHDGVMAASSDLALLTGPDAMELLQAAVQAAGGELLEWTPRQVDHRPGSSTTVSYRARVRWSDGVRTETLAARTGVAPTALVPGTVRVADGDREVVVWRFPLDPDLPGLAAACDAATLAPLLRSFGIDTDGIELRTRSYRPGRRAVIEVRTASGSLVIKAVRPSKIVALHSRHRMLSAAGLPVPASLGLDRPGHPRHADAAGHQPARGNPDRRDRPAERRAGARAAGPPAARGGELPRRPAWSEHAAHYAAILGTAVPSERDRSRRSCRGRDRRDRERPGGH